MHLTTAFQSPPRAKGSVRWPPLRTGSSGARSACTARQAGMHLLTDWLSLSLSLSLSLCAQGIRQQRRRCVLRRPGRGRDAWTRQITARLARVGSEHTRSALRHLNGGGPDLLYQRSWAIQRVENVPRADDGVVLQLSSRRGYGCLLVCCCFGRQ